MISCLSFGSDIFDTSLLLMFMSSCHKWNVALFHGFHLGFACCVVLAHIIVQTPWNLLVACADKSAHNCCSTSEVGSGAVKKRTTLSHTCPKLWKQCMRDEVKKKLLRRPLLEDAFVKHSRNAGFKGVVRSKTHDALEGTFPCFYTCKPSTRDNHEAQQKWWNCSLGKKTFVAPTNIGFRYGWKSKTCWHVNIYQPQLPREINCHLFKWCNPGGPSHTHGVFSALEPREPG